MYQKENCGKSVAFFVTLLAAIAPALAVTSHVVLIVGQSNSVGLNTDGYTAEDQSDSRILQLSCCKDGSQLPFDQCALILAQDPLHHQCDDNYLTQSTLGFAMSFAREYIKDIPDTDIIVIVPAGLSASGFYGNTWTAYNGTGFGAAVSKLKITFELLAGLGANPIFEGILWHQGELDAGDNFLGWIATTEEYLNVDIIPMIKAFRDTSLLPFTAPTLPFACANLLPSWVANTTEHPNRVWVDTALSLLGQRVPYAACSPTQGLRGDPGTLSGLTSEVIHFNGKSQRILGRRYYAALQLAKLNAPEQP